MTEFKKLLNEPQKEAYLKALAFVLNIDKKKVNEKVEFFENQAKSMGLGSDEVSKIKKIKKPEELIAELKSIDDLRIKRFILREMIMLAISDHELKDEELASIYHIGSRIGIGNEKINDFFLWAAKGLEWQIEGFKLIEEDI